MDGGQLTLAVLTLVSCFLCGLGARVQSTGGQGYPPCADNRHGIVHLFEWKWRDIANECKNFLGPYGFCGVQTSPANEYRVVNNPSRPWWERYQPVSYKMTTRSGNETDFANMVKTCNDNGVRVFVDVVFNHMTGAGFSGVGTAGSTFDANNMQFPGVPYGPNDFNSRGSCPSSDWNIHNYQNPQEVRYCRLVGLLDLAQSHDYVRGKMAGYLNQLVDLGVAGFRMDASKHMEPADIKAILAKVKDIRMGGRPFVYQEVIDITGTEGVHGAEYVMNGRITNFRVGLDLSRIFRKGNAMKYLANWGTGWGMWGGDQVVTFIDDHDTQRDNPPGQGVLTYKEPKAYKMAQAFNLAHPYGLPRVMSSFAFSGHDQGPPHNSDNSIKDVVTKGMLCLGGWVCEHRWRQIYNMVAFRNLAGGSPVSNWWSGADYQIAFSRGNKAFIALNLEDNNINLTLQTGLPAGMYCDVISGNLENGKCTGNSMTVGNDGKAMVTVCSHCDDPMVAYHVGAKVGSPPRRH